MLARGLRERKRKTFLSGGLAAKAGSPLLCGKEAVFPEKKIFINTPGTNGW